MAFAETGLNQLVTLVCRADGVDVRNDIGPRGDVEPDLLAHFEIEWLDGCACGGCQRHQVPPRRPQLQLDGYTLLHRAGVLLLRGDGGLDTAAQVFVAEVWIVEPGHHRQLCSDTDVGGLIDHRPVVAARQLAPSGDDLSHGVNAIGRFPRAHRCPLSLQIPKRYEPFHNRSLIHSS